jgi:hypothetical protein
MNRYVVEAMEKALWEAARSALDAKDSKALEEICHQINGLCNGDRHHPMEIEIIAGNAGKTVALYIERMGYFDAFMESDDFHPDDFTVKDFRSWVQENGDVRPLESVDNWGHKLGYVLSDYFSNPKSEFYKGVERGDVRGHYRICKKAPQIASLSPIDLENGFCYPLNN